MNREKYKITDKEFYNLYPDDIVVSSNSTIQIVRIDDVNVYYYSGGKDEKTRTMTIHEFLTWKGGRNDSSNILFYGIIKKEDQVGKWCKVYGYSSNYKHKIKIVNYNWFKLGSVSISAGWGEVKKIKNMKYDVNIWTKNGNRAVAGKTRYDIMTNVRMLLHSPDINLCSECGTQIIEDSYNHFAGIYCKNCWQVYKNKNSRACTICGKPLYECTC